MGRRAWVAIGIGDVAGAAAAIGTFTRDATDVTIWWYVTAAAISIVAGTLVGWAFGRRDRSVAVPTWTAAGVVAFVFALAAPWLVFTILLIVAFAISGPGD